jgi:hypothetical protein
MIDRTTKILLALTALGLWGNISVSLIRPAIASIDIDVSSIKNDLSQVKSAVTFIKDAIKDLTEIKSNVRYIKLQMPQRPPQQPDPRSPSSG